MKSVLRGKSHIFFCLILFSLVCAVPTLSYSWERSCHECDMELGVCNGNCYARSDREQGDCFNYCKENYQECARSCN